MNSRETDFAGSAFFRGAIRSFTLRGVAWAVTPPACWLLSFYALVIHVRLSLGRWPAFGENLDGWPLRIHYKAILWSILPMAVLIYAAAAIFVVCLFLPKQRRFLIYAAAYAVAAWIAAGLAILAPHPFLNWFFD